MRVITGIARGRRLKEPQGLETRPTTDRVKEGIFSSIQFEIEGRRVLDLFGGTGQMGIEALSRGAAHCTFVDLRKEAVGIIRENLKLTGLEGQATVVQGDALAFLTRCREKYDVIFLDPPYETELLETAIAHIARHDLLNVHGMMIAEHPVDKALPALPAPYRMGRTYRYGKIAVTIYHRDGDEGAQV